MSTSTSLHHLIVVLLLLLLLLFVRDEKSDDDILDTRSVDEDEILPAAFVDFERDDDFRRRVEFVKKTKTTAPLAKRISTNWTLTSNLRRYNNTKSFTVRG